MVEPIAPQTDPFFGYWEGGRYNYTICSATFRPNDGRWPVLMEYAFEQWQEAVPHRVTVTRKPGSCATEGNPINNDVPLSVIRALYNESNEVYMVDARHWDRTFALVNDNNVLFHCLTFDPPGSGNPVPACVISPRYKEL